MVGDAVASSLITAAPEAADIVSVRKSLPLTHGYCLIDHDSCGNSIGWRISLIDRNVSALDYFLYPTSHEASCLAVCDLRSVEWAKACSCSPLVHVSGEIFSDLEGSEGSGVFELDASLVAVKRRFPILVGRVIFTANFVHHIAACRSSHHPLGVGVRLICS